MGKAKKWKAESHGACLIHVGIPETKHKTVCPAGRKKQQVLKGTIVCFALQHHGVGAWTP